MLTAPLIVVLWLFCLGSAVGSFLNVVVYRLPAGISLVHPGSRCPFCLTPILARDNIPVLGWLMLGGSCRSCRAPIAARYPIVELAIGMLFVAMAATGPLEIGAAGGDLSLEMLWGRYADQLFLACALIAAALTSWDGHKLDWRLTLTTLALGLALPLAWPLLRIALPAGNAPSNTGAQAMQEGLVGLAAAGVLGASALVGVRLASGKVGELQAPAWMLSWLGVYLGWRVVTLMAISSLSSWIVLRRSPALRRIGWPECLAAVSAMWLIGGRWVAHLWLDLAFFGPGLFAAVAVAVGCLCWLGCKIGRDRLD